MSRPPFSYPMTRMTDGESGGIADLQTDVMRFMAILAICLVAIFALVQSIPLDTTPPETRTPEPVAKPLPAPAPEPVPAYAAEPEVVVVTRPAPAEMPKPAAAPAPEPVPAAAPPRPVREQGFTLQFETDLALTRLAARNEVALYAIGKEQALRLSVNRGRLSFWPASTPNQFFEMEADTVPADVLAAFQTRLPGAGDDVRWGVTLPNGMRQQLNEFLETGTGGALFIGADGSLRLER